jgi:hypothetical protein
MPGEEAAQPLAEVLTLMGQSVKTNVSFFFQAYFLPSSISAQNPYICTHD